jgi:uridine kinase
MKIALLIAGYLRSFEHNIQNLKKYIIENNNVDIYIHITKNKETKYLNANFDINKIIKLLNPKHIIINDNINFKREKQINDIMNQNLKFYLLNEERKRLENLENITYDLVFKIRPDVYLNEPIHFSIMDLNKINIPLDSKIDTSKLRSPEDKYVCDIIAFGKPELMDIYFNYYLELEVLIEKYGHINETLLYYYLSIHNIEFKLIYINYIVILSLFNTIAVTGDSGSGKTTITKILKSIFNDSFVLECDRYHKWERNNENWRKYTHLDPSANFITKMNKDVFDLKIGNSIFQIDYDHNSGKFTDRQLIESKENVIVCGLHSLYIQEDILNLKIYMDTDDNLRIPWKIKRDCSKRGYTIEKIYEQILNRQNDYIKYIKIQRDKADIIICLYTDKQFNINKFDINYEPNIFLKIGIKSTYNISSITEKINISRIEIVDNFYYLYFKNITEYEEIVKTIIINLKYNYI